MGRIPVYRRLHDRITDERHPLLTAAVQATGVFLIGRVKFCIGA
jgi:hypothetical protein